MGKRSILIFIRLCVIRKFNAIFAPASATKNYY